MKPAAFDYLRPESIEEALRALAAGDGGAKVIAGGQSFGPMLNMRLATPHMLVDLNDLSEMAYIRDVGDALEIGALTRHHQLADSRLVQQHCPLLARAARTIGHYAIRQRGTLGGSLAHADPAAQLLLAAVTLGAHIELLSARGRRSVPAHAFFLSAMTTALGSDEIIHCVRWPKSGAHEGSSYQLFNRRHGDFAIVAVAATLTLEGAQVKALRLGVGGAEPVPRSLSDALRGFVGRVADAAWIDAVVQTVQSEVNPDEDGRIDAIYRKELAGTLARQALQRALARAKGEIA